MANKRMFSKQIIDSDAFLDMPMSSQLLYFHLVMHADDEGFIGNPKKIIRMLGVGDDDFKILVAKRFVLSFQSGVIVIKHWLIHNAIRMDRFNQTAYQNEKKLLIVKDNKAYTDRQPVGNQTAGQSNLIKSNLIKIKAAPAEETSSSKEVPLIIKAFEIINPAVKNYYGNKTQRKACEDLIKSYGLDRIITIIEKTLPKSNTIAYFPSITTPIQLRDKFAALENAIMKYQSKENMDQKKTGPVYW